MSKQGMNRDGDHPPQTENEGKHHERAFVPELQGKVKTGKKKADISNPPPEDEKYND